MSANDYTPTQILGAIGNALKASDMQAAADLIRYLAVRDPGAAQMILDTLELAKGADA